MIKCIFDLLSVAYSKSMQPKGAGHVVSNLVLCLKHVLPCIAVETDIVNNLYKLLDVSWADKDDFKAVVNSVSACLRSVNATDVNLTKLQIESKQILKLISLLIQVGR